jgi:hypothetical protein
MDRYSKTGLRLNRAKGLFASRAPGPAPTSIDEEALLFPSETPVDCPPAARPLPEPDPANPPQPPSPPESPQAAPKARDSIAPRGGGARDERR